MAVHALLAATPLLASSFDGDRGTAQVVAPQEQPADDREPEANLPYLFAVFIITWAVLFGYVFYMSRRQRAMQREIEALRAALAEKERKT
jgi:CcmD family protein